MQPGQVAVALGDLRVIGPVDNLPTKECAGERPFGII